MINLLPFLIRRRCIAKTLLCAVFSILVSATGTDLATAAQPNVAAANEGGSTDVAAWKHPAKKIFANDGVTLKSYFVQGTTAQFEVAFRYDPQTSPNSRRVNRLCARLLQAGRWTQVLMISNDDHIQIKAMRAPDSKRITVDFVPMQ